MTVTLRCSVFFNEKDICGSKYERYKLLYL